MFDSCFIGNSNSRTGSLRRGHKPPVPPVRRTSTVSSNRSSNSNIAISNSLTSSEYHSSMNFSSSNSSTPGSNHTSPPSHSSSSCSSSSNDSQSNANPSSKTDSESSTPVGSIENFPPPPAFLLEKQNYEGFYREDSITPESVVTFNSGLISSSGCNNSQPVEECLRMRKISVSETVKSLQEIQHQPPSPLTYRKSNSVKSLGTGTNKLATRSVSNIEEQRRPSFEASRSAIISSLSSKLAEAHSPKSSPPALRRNIQQPSHVPHYQLPRNQPVQVQKKLSQRMVYQDHDLNQQGSGGSLFPTSHLSNEVNLRKMMVAPSQNNCFSGQPDANSYSGRNSPIVYSQNKTSSSAIYSSLGRKHSNNQNSFIQNLNNVLAQRSSNSDSLLPNQSHSPKMKSKSKSQSNFNGVVSASNIQSSTASPNIQRSGSNSSEKAFKVRQWIMAKKTTTSLSSEGSHHNSHGTSHGPTNIKESLLDQIRRGTTLRRAKHIADRSAPRVH